MKHMIDFLYNNAGSTIIYRIKKEILNDITNQEACELQRKILQEKDIQYILNNRQKDGWLGTCFHSRMRGAKNLDVCEAALKFLQEKGVSLEHEVFDNLCHAYFTRDKNDPIYDGFEKYYDVYDFAAWGLWLIRAAGLARIGKEESEGMTKAIKLSLNSFFDVLNYSCIEEACSVSKNGTYYFSKGVLWPCKYHLEILAYTHGWRSQDNIKRLAMAIDHLFTISEPGKPIYTKIKNSYHSPCDEFIKSPISQFRADNMSGDWFYKMELFARCGIIPYSKYLSNELELLKQSIDSDGMYWLLN